MIQIAETEPIRSVTRNGETSVRAGDLQSPFLGIVVEVTGSDDKFDGTLVYFPGVRLSRLKGNTL